MRHFRFAPDAEINRWDYFNSPLKTRGRSCRHNWVVTLENSPSKVAASEQPFRDFISAGAVVSAGVMRLHRAVHAGLP
jgi:hypothetical protein